MILHYRTNTYLSWSSQYFFITILEWEYNRKWSLRYLLEIVNRTYVLSSYIIYSRNVVFNLITFVVLIFLDSMIECKCISKLAVFCVPFSLELFIYFAENFLTCMSSSQWLASFFGLYYIAIWCILIGC